MLNRVILWTRVTTTQPVDVIPVEWSISEDPSFRTVWQRGVSYASPIYDFTVKVDVPRLKPGTTYYYRFSALGASSPIGRTKTLPLGSVSSMRFAVASCSNWPFGFFNAYRLIANRQDLDLVLHLGDYIYEYGNAEYGDGSKIGRVPAPNKECITLSDYRQRYAQYRTDPDLQEAHRQHPWIIVWDDHETANNSWTDGAENHTPSTEGDWSARRAVGTQAWFEWLPVRENSSFDSRIYRVFQFGGLADLVMLDTRLAGRNEQVPESSPRVADPTRTLLGSEQESWFYRELSVSQNRGTQWRLIGQQTMMGQLLGADGNPFSADQWDGYVASRNRFLGYLGANSVNNVVVLSGDIHSSWGNEIAPNPFIGSYVSQAVEFVGPGITSPAIEDPAQAAGLQAQIGATHPHVKYVDLNRRGYMLVDIDKDRAQCEWYHMRTILERRAEEDLGRTLQVAAGSTKLVAASGPSRQRSNPAPFAP